MLKDGCEQKIPYFMKIIDNRKSHNDSKERGCNENSRIYEKSKADIDKNFQTKSIDQGLQAGLQLDSLMLFYGWPALSQTLSYLWGESYLTLFLVALWLVRCSDFLCLL